MQYQQATSHNRTLSCEPQDADLNLYFISTYSVFWPSTARCATTLKRSSNARGWLGRNREPWRAVSMDRGGSDGPETVETSGQPFDIRERRRDPGRAKAQLRASGPVGAGWGSAALCVGEDASVEARSWKVRPMRRPREGVVRLHCPRVGGRQQHGAEHPAAVRTLQPRQGHVETQKKVEGLGPPSVLPGPGQRPHLVEVLITLRALTALDPRSDGVHAARGGDDSCVP
jgi:hypothetical protein